MPILQAISAVLAPASELGKQYLANKAAEGTAASALAQRKLDRIMAAEDRADELKAARLQAKVNRIENAQKMASDLDAQQLRENKDTSFDEWYVAFISLPVAVAMWDGIAGTGYAAAMVESFSGFPIWYQLIVGAIVAFKILALRAMVRWGIRLWLEMKANRKFGAPAENVTLSSAKDEIKENK